MTCGVDQLGVNPELVQETDGAHGHDHSWGEADQRHPQPEDETHEATGPGLAERGGEVITLGRMVNNMRGPEETASVTDAVVPVVGAVVGEKHQ